MSELSPKQAAELAEGIYGIHDDRDFKSFISRGIFSKQNSQQSRLEADIGGRLLRKAKDGFGFCAMGRGKKFEGDAFFIFRGTTDVHNNADIISDARIGTQISKTGTFVHIGFNQVFKSMLTDLRDFLNKNKSNITGELHCVGHSLGGAVATLAADWLKTQTGRTVKLYTFGQPRVGMMFFSTKLTVKLGSKNIHRVFHTTDPVPMVPIFPYTHNPCPGNGHLINSSHLIVSGEAHKMASYVHDVSKKQWAELKRSAPVYNHEKAIEEFLTSKIRPDSENPLTWEWLDSALIYILKKIGNGVFIGVHTAIVGVHSIADRIAWILAKGVDLANAIGHFVGLFVKKVMQVLRMPPLRPDQSITKAFLTGLLTMLMKKAHELAKRAIQAM